MAEFRYRAVNREGKIVAGTQTSHSARDLEVKLKRLNLQLLSCHEYKPLLGFVQRRKVSRRDLINYCFYLEQMTRSGIPLVEALEDLQESLSTSYLGEVIAIQIAEINEGKAFSETLAGFPGIFSGTFISLIKAGEKSGELVSVLKDLTETLIWQDELIAQTRKALMLPMFMAVVVFCVVFFLMTFLVPQLVTFITSMGQELPVYTKLLIVVSDFFVNYWPAVLASPFALIVIFRQLLKHSPRFRFQVDKLKLKIWVLGPLLEKIILSRFVNYLALLYRSGIPIIDSLKMTETIVENKVIEQALRNVRTMIADGATVSLAFEMGEIFPKLVLSMIRVGEKTGDLGASLQNVSYFYKRDVDELIANVQQMIEPAMTVVMGFIIGWVMLSVLGPVYDLIGNIKI